MNCTSDASYTINDNSPIPGLSLTSNTIDGASVSGNNINLPKGTYFAFGVVRMNTLNNWIIYSINDSSLRGISQKYTGDCNVIPAVGFLKFSASKSCTFYKISGSTNSYGIGSSTRCLFIQLKTE